ncbi:MAG: hypothetical protein AAF063_32295 [Cyanobacteria bacterium J06643_5]
MKNLLRNSLIAAVVAVAGVVSGAGVSFAGSATLNLNANIPKSCSFGDSDNDNVVYSNDTPKISQQNGVNADIEWSGKFTVVCNHGGKVNIMVDVTESGKVSGSSNSNYLGAFFDVSNDNTEKRLWSEGSIPGDVVTSGTYDTGELDYSFSLYTSPQAGDTGLVAGKYAYTIKMTATPN